MDSQVSYQRQKTSKKCETELAFVFFSELSLLKKVIISSFMIQLQYLNLISKLWADFRELPWEM